MLSAHRALLTGQDQQRQDAVDGCVEYADAEKLPERHGASVVHDRVGEPRDCDAGNGLACSEPQLPADWHLWSMRTDAPCTFFFFFFSFWFRHTMLNSSEELSHTEICGDSSCPILASGGRLGVTYVCFLCLRRKNQTDRRV